MTQSSKNDKDSCKTSPTLTPASSSSCLSLRDSLTARNETVVLPEWANSSNLNQWGERLSVLEWDGPANGSGDVDSYRSNNGWKVSDVFSPSEGHKNESICTMIPLAQ